MFIIFPRLSSGKSGDGRTSSPRFGLGPGTCGSAGGELFEEVHRTGILKGTWIRPDGGYRIVIRGIGTGGRLDAMYFNPSQLPFARAQVLQDAATFRVVLELQAGGYAGSTYDLRYEAATDRLIGTYYQAVAKQTFDVFFIRKP